MALRQATSAFLSNMGLMKPQMWAMTGAMASRGFASVVDGLKYAKSHEWAKIDGDVATVGISDHAQVELGDVVYVELPEVGKTVKQGETFGVVESVKAASDVYAPLSGEVIEVNEVLSNEPATVNKDPYQAGWIIKLKLSNKDEASKLLDASAYKAHSES